VLSTANPPDRLYGRRRGHALRIRQQHLLDVTLPRLRYNPADSSWPPQNTELWLEIGAGGGEHARAQAEANPQAALIACEVFLPGICSLLSALVPEAAEATHPLPPNLRLWDDDARPLLRRLPDASLDRLFLLFPDPWPKTRHAGRRFLNDTNIAEAARLLKPGAVWRIASDDPTYQAWVTATLARQTAFTTPPPATKRPQGWPPTRYEAKALRQGRQALYWCLERKPRAIPHPAGG
jgi:tRNA (guanine-N7-)-methyltransferase